MTLIKDVNKFIQEGYKYFIPHLSIDCAILGYHDNQLKILLTCWEDIDGWCLPGGYIAMGESINEAAHRILKERTGLSGVFLSQYKTFGELGRVFPESNVKLFEASRFYKAIKGSWLDQRTVSIGYYALIDFSKATPRPDEFSRDCAWFDILSLPKLLFDHNLMVSEALKTIRNQLHYQPVGLNLLPDEFTIPELQNLYETILNRKFDRRNFKKKIESLGILKDLGKRRNIGSHRSPFLYSFDIEKYNSALNDGKGLLF